MPVPAARRARRRGACPASRPCPCTPRTSRRAGRRPSSRRPASASSNVSVDVVLQVAPAPRAAAARRLPPPKPPPPNTLPNMSPRSPKFDLSGTGPPPGPAAAGPGPRAGARRDALPPKYWPYWSYCLRFSASESTSYASLISLNFSSAPPASGWCLRASLRNAFLISSAEASFLRRACRSSSLSAAMTPTPRPSGPPVETTTIAGRSTRPCIS